MKKILVLLFSILILPISVYASDVYYCSDDAATGFAPEENYKKYTYNTRKFKILIDFENHDITSESLYMNSPFYKKCFYYEKHPALYCMNNIGYGFSINKLNLKYVRSKIYNKVDQTDDIILAYGTCEKF